MKSGIGFFGILEIALIILKLCKVINWSWLIILAPSLLSLILTLIFIIFIGIINR